MGVLKWVAAFAAALLIVSLVLGLGSIVLVAVAVGGVVITLITVVLWLTALFRQMFES